LYFGDDDSLVAEVIDNTTSRGRTLRFMMVLMKSLEKIDRTWRNSIPKYISRDVTPEDAERYKRFMLKRKEL
jgi:S-adenosylmethionine:tRNA ribosyltransferase-isomerase